jgi:hypothetical protein
MPTTISISQTALCANARDRLPRGEGRTFVVLGGWAFVMLVLSFLGSDPGVGPLM